MLSLKQPRKQVLGTVKNACLDHHGCRCACLVKWIRASPCQCFESRSHVPINDRRGHTVSKASHTLGVCVCVCVTTLGHKGMCGSFAVSKFCSENRAAELVDLVTLVSYEANSIHDNHRYMHIDAYCMPLSRNLSVKLKQQQAILYTMPGPLMTPRCSNEPCFSRAFFVWE